MTIFRKRHTQDYTVLPNATIRDKRLSLKARGLHHLLLSYPENWEIHIEHLASECDRDGRTAISGAIQELIETGYIIRSKVRGDSGKFSGWDYDVFDQPQCETESRKPESGKPDVGDRTQKTRSRENRNRKTDDIRNIYSTKYTDYEVTNPLPPKGADSVEGKSGTEECQSHLVHDEVILTSTEPEQQTMQLALDTQHPAGECSAASQNESTQSHNETTETEAIATKKKPSRGKAEYTAEFLEFWSLYPRCTNKGQAFKAWQQKLKAGHDIQEIMDFLRYELSDRKSRLRKPDATFIPHASTWLNAEDWTNDHWRNHSSASGSMPSEDVQKQIGAIMRSLNLTAYLPLDWKKRTGKDVVRDLSDREAREYLAELQEMQKKQQVAA